MNQLVAGPLGHRGLHAPCRALAPSTHLCVVVQECARAGDPPPAWERPLKNESVSASRSAGPPGPPGQPAKMTAHESESDAAFPTALGRPRPPRPALAAFAGELSGPSQLPRQHPLPVTSPSMLDFHWLFLSSWWFF